MTWKATQAVLADGVTWDLAEGQPLRVPHCAASSRGHRIGVMVPGWERHELTRIVLESIQAQTQTEIMIVAIHQPNYLPWAGSFAKARKADVLVLLDTVQYSRPSWTGRTKIAGDRYLSLPVRRRGKTISELRLDGLQWVRKHSLTLGQTYPRCPSVPRLTDCLGMTDVVAHHNRILIEQVIEILGIRCQLVWASDLEIVESSRPNPSSRLAALTSAAGGTSYLSGIGALTYFDPEPFGEIGIGVRKLLPPPEASGLSIVHELATHGVAGTLDLLDTAKVVPWS